MKTIEGTWSDTRGNLAAWGKLHLVLNQDAHVVATSQVAPRSMTFNLDQNGTLLKGSKVWANDELAPAGTYYTATVTANGGGVIWGPVWIIIAGSDPIDLNHITPIKVIPPVDQFSSSLTVIPTMVGGIINSPVSSELGTTQDDLVTVSNQLVLAPAGNISLLGSVSQHSMTISVAGPPQTPPTPPFVAGIGGGYSLGDGGPVTNQLYLIGGSNITLSGSTDPGGMSISVIGGAGGPGGAGPAFTFGADGQTATNQVFLAGGANVTLNPVTGPNGMTISIDAESSAQVYPRFTAGIGGGNTQGSGSTVTNQLLIAGGSNITISRTTNPSGMTMSIIGLSQGTGNTFQAGLMPGALGQSGPVSNRLYLAGGNHITLEGTTNNSGMTVTILGEPEGVIPPGGQTFQAGIAAGQGHLGPVDQALYLAGGNNITLSGSGSGGSLTVSISAASQSAYVSSHMSQLLRLTAGNNNVTVNSGTNATGLTYSIYGQAGGAGPGGGGALSFVDDGLITISSTEDAAGTTASFSIPGATSVGSFRFGYYSAVNGGIWTGTPGGGTGTVTNYVRAVAGSNMLVSASVNPPGVMTLTWNAMQASLIEGANITINSTPSSQGTTYQINAGAGGPGGGGAVSLIQSNNIGITSNANAAGSTFTISGASGAGGGFGFSMTSAPGGATAGGSLSLGTAGIRLAAGSNMSFSASGSAGPGEGFLTMNVRALTLHQGANISLITATNASGTNATISASGGAAGGWNAALYTTGSGGTVGSVSGTTYLPNLTHLDFKAGPNVTMYGSSVTPGWGQIWFNAASGGGAGAAMNLHIEAEHGGHTEGEHDLGSISYLGLIAGSNITLRASSGTQGGNWGDIEIMGAGGGAPGGEAFSFGLGSFVTTPTQSATTQGHTGLVTNRVYLAAGPYVTLSGSTAASAMTVTIQGQKAPIFRVGTGAGGTTGGHATALTMAPIGINLYAGSNVSMSASTNANWDASVTINVPSAVRQHFAFNTSGGSINSTFASTPWDNLRFEAGPNISFDVSTSPTPFATLRIGAPNVGGNSSVSFVTSGGINITTGTNANGSVFTISAPNSYGLGFGTGAQPGGQTLGTGLYNNAGLIGGGRLFAGSNITLSGSTGANSFLSVTVIGEPGGAAINDNRSLAMAQPLVPCYTTVGEMAPGNTGATFWPFQPNIYNDNPRSACWFMYFDFYNSNLTGTLDFSLGIYTRNGSTLTRMSSSYTHYRFSYYSSQKTLYDNAQMIKVPITNMSFDYRDYWFGLSMSSHSSGNSFGVKGIIAQVISGDFGGEFGAATHHTNQRVPGWGRYQSGGGLPASVAFSQLSGTAATGIRAPIMYLAGFTA